MIKCDEAMRRSKERCFVPVEVGESLYVKRWKCNKDCENCHCALHKKNDGTWEHTRLYLGHSY